MTKKPIPRGSRENGKTFQRIKQLLHEYSLEEIKTLCEKIGKASIKVRAKVKKEATKMNAWIIDVDHIAEPHNKPGTCFNAVGVAGPRGYTGDGTELKEEFRMYDDDGELYYSGRCKERGFAPLDNFGMPNAGCTEIRFKNKQGQWETL